MTTTTTNARPELDVEVAVVGAGIGGLAAALALHRQGRDVRVLEQSRHLGEVGGAIIMRAPSAELLAGWDALDAYESSAVRLKQIEFRDHLGEVQGSRPMFGRPDEPEWAYGIHRADLHGLLRERVPEELVSLGTSITAVLDRGTHAELRLADGGVLRAGVVIGADGIRSRVRESITPHQRPVYAGLIIARGVVGVDALPAGLPNDRMRMWVKDSRTVMAIPMRGGKAFAIDTVLHREQAPVDLWTTSISADELLEGFEDFDPAITDLVRASESPLHLQGVHELEPFSTWSTARVTLLGDAAHAMNPSHGQGANSAIQDAGALAEQLAGLDLASPDRAGVPVALAAYQDERAPLLREIQLASRVRPETPGL